MVAEWPILTKTNLLVDRDSGKASTKIGIIRKLETIPQILEEVLVMERPVVRVLEVPVLVIVAKMDTKILEGLEVSKGMMVVEAVGAVEVSG